MNFAVRAIVCSAAVGWLRTEERPWGKSSARKPPFMFYDQAGVTTPLVRMCSWKFRRMLVMANPLRCIRNWHDVCDGWPGIFEPCTDGAATRFCFACVAQWKTLGDHHCALLWHGICNTIPYGDRCPPRSFRYEGQASSTIFPIKRVLDLIEYSE